MSGSAGGVLAKSAEIGLVQSEVTPTIVAGGYDLGPPGTAGLTEASHNRAGLITAASHNRAGLTAASRNRAGLTAASHNGADLTEASHNGAAFRRGHTTDRPGVTQN